MASNMLFSKKYLSISVRILLSVIFIISGSMPVSSSVPKTADYGLPAPGQLLPCSQAQDYPELKGMKINPDNPLEFEFIIDTKDGREVTEAEVKRIAEYFLAVLAIPDDDLWVNLSTYEQDRIISDTLSYTELGKDLLGEDYILKQLVSSLTYPESKMGKKYWDEVFKQVHKIAGTTKIPINTFNKVWIVPEKAHVLENGNIALIDQSVLKAMHEEDFLSLNNNAAQIRKEAKLSSTKTIKDVNKVSAQVFKQMLLPVIEKEVNEGENFARLRQAYNSFILASWFKKKLKNSVYQYYIAKEKISGIDLEDKQAKVKIFNLYAQAYQKGVYDFIKKDYDPNERQYIKRRYCSGGITGFNRRQITVDVTDLKTIEKMLEDNPRLKINQVIFGIMEAKTIFKRTVQPDSWTNVVTSLEKYEDGYTLTWKEYDVSGWNRFDPRESVSIKFNEIDQAFAALRYISYPVTMGKIIKMPLDEQRKNVEEYLATAEDKEKTKLFALNFQVPNISDDIILILSIERVENIFLLTYESSTLSLHKKTRDVKTIAAKGYTDIETALEVFTILEGNLYDNRHLSNPIEHAESQLAQKDGGDANEDMVDLLEGEYAVVLTHWIGIGHPEYTANKTKQMAFALGALLLKELEGKPDDYKPNGIPFTKKQLLGTKYMNVRRFAQALMLRNNGFSKYGMPESVNLSPEELDTLSASFEQILKITSLADLNSLKLAYVMFDQLVKNKGEVPSLKFEEALHDAAETAAGMDNAATLEKVMGVWGIVRDLSGDKTYESMPELIETRIPDLKISSQTPDLPPELAALNSKLFYNGLSFGLQEMLDNNNLLELNDITKAYAMFDQLVKNGKAVPAIEFKTALWNAVGYAANRENFVDFWQIMALLKNVNNMTKKADGGEDSRNYAQHTIQENAIKSIIVGPEKNQSFSLNRAYNDRLGIYEFTVDWKTKSPLTPKSQAETIFNKGYSSFKKAMGIFDILLTERESLSEMVNIREYIESKEELFAEESSPNVWYESRNVMGEIGEDKIDGTIVLYRQQGYKENFTIEKKSGNYFVTWTHYTFHNGPGVTMAEKIYSDFAKALSIYNLLMNQHRELKTQDAIENAIANKEKRFASSDMMDGGDPVGGIAFYDEGLIKAEGDITFNWPPEVIEQFKNSAGLKIISIKKGSSITALLTAYGS